MRNIRFLLLEQYQASSKFEKVNKYVYKCLSDSTFRTAISCELEIGEDTQSPLEDILDRYNIYVSGDFYEEDTEKRMLSFELASEFKANILAVSHQIIGGRVFNQKINDKVKLIVQHKDASGMFADFNFKLAVIDNILEHSPSFLNEFEELEDKYGKSHWDSGYEWNYEPIPEIVAFLSELKLKQSDLDQLTLL